MEKALRILDDAIKALESEVRIWTKQGDLDIVEKCKNEIKQCTEAIEKLRGGECSNENSGLNIPVVNGWRFFDNETPPLNKEVEVAELGYPMKRKITIAELQFYKWKNYCWRD